MVGYIFQVTSKRRHSNIESSHLYLLQNGGVILLHNYTFSAYDIHLALYKVIGATSYLKCVYTVFKCESIMTQIGISVILKI